MLFANMLESKVIHVFSQHGLKTGVKKWGKLAVEAAGNGTGNAKCAPPLSTGVCWKCVAMRNMLSESAQWSTKSSLHKGRMCRGKRDGLECREGSIPPDLNFPAAGS